MAIPTTDKFLALNSGVDTEERGSKSANDRSSYYTMANITQTVLNSESSASFVDLNLTGDLSVTGEAVVDSIKLSQPRAITNSSSDGKIGQIMVDEYYIYVCTATNIWKRVAIDTW